MDDDDEFSPEFDWIAQLVGEEESGVFEPNVQRITEMELCRYKLAEIMKGRNVKLLTDEGEIFPSMGAIEMIGKEISFTDTQSLVAIARTASNIEIYPKIDGTVQLDFGFNGIADKVGD